jgi:hypothetical protein
MSEGRWLWPAYTTRFYVGEGIIAVERPNATRGGAKTSDYYDLSLGARRPEQQLRRVKKEGGADGGCVDRRARRTIAGGVV